MAIIEELVHKIVIYREPWLAVNISTFFPGLGQIYSGKIKRGLIIMGIEILLLFLGFYFAFSAKGNILVSFILLLLAFLFLAWNVYDTLKLSRQANDKVFELVRQEHKDPWLSVFLSRIIPGMGHFYLKQWTIGIIICLFYIVFILISRINILFLLLIPIFYTVIVYHSYITSPVKREGDTKIIVLTSILILIGSLEFIFLPLLIQKYFVESYKVSNMSLSSSISPGDLVLVRKFNKHEINTGDIVVFKNPDNPEQQLIKRVAAKEGQTIEVSGDELYVNHIKLEGTYFRRAGFNGNDSMAHHVENLIVPTGMYFVLGDNNTISFDSRHFGFVNRDDIVGVAFKIYWPLKHSGPVK